MKNSMRFLFCCVCLFFLACPATGWSGEQFTRKSYRVAAGDSIRSLLLKNNCIQSMLDYSNAREAFAQFNPGITYSLVLSPGASITLPTSSTAGGKGCLSYHENKLVRVEFETTTLGEQVRVYLDGPVLPDLFVLRDELPVRIVCDFDGVVPQANLGKPIACNGRLISGIRIGHDDKPFKRTRLVLDVNDKAVGRVEQEFFEKESLFLITVLEATN